MAPHSWIMGCFFIVAVSDQLKNLLSNNMKTCNVGLTCCNQLLGGTGMKQGIFQRDLLLPCLFMLYLIDCDAV